MINPTIETDLVGEFVAYFTYNSESLFWTEGYSSKAAAKNAIESIKKNGPDAEIDPAPGHERPCQGHALRACALQDLGRLDEAAAAARTAIDLLDPLREYGAARLAAGTTALVMLTEILFASGSSVAPTTTRTASSACWRVPAMPSSRPTRRPIRPPRPPWDRAPATVRPDSPGPGRRSDRTESARSAPRPAETSPGAQHRPAA